jgi:hypothetical protein
VSDSVCGLGVRGVSLIKRINPHEVKENIHFTTIQKNITFLVFFHFGHTGRTFKVDWDILGFLVDSEIVLPTRYGKVRVFINKTLSTETTRKFFFIVVD